MTSLRHITERPGAAQRLVCFPHAGGTASFFAAWAAGLPHAEVHAVLYPGRAERTGEPYATDLCRTARDIADSVGPLADRPIALFGHSMGAWVAFETARVLERSGVRVSHLFASGAHPPQTRTMSGSTLTDVDDATLAARLVDLGGTPAELLSEPGLLNMVFPHVRADLRMADAYTCRPGPPLDCPITTLVGAEDRLVSPEDTAGWAGWTRGAYRSHVVPGDHFYLIARPPFALVRELMGAQDPDPLVPGGAALCRTSSSTADFSGSTA